MCFYVGYKFRFIIYVSVDVFGHEAYRETVVMSEHSEHL